MAFCPLPNTPLQRVFDPFLFWKQPGVAKSAGGKNLGKMTTP